MRFSWFKKEEKKNIQQILDRGQHAATLLANPAFREAMQDCEKDLWNTFFSTSPDQESDREKLYQHTMALMSIEEKLRLFVEQGKLEEAKKQGKL